MSISYIYIYTHVYAYIYIYTYIHVDSDNSPTQSDALDNLPKGRRRVARCLVACPSAGGEPAAIAGNLDDNGGNR